jgi:hypothetical protein
VQILANMTEQLESIPEITLVTVTGGQDKPAAPPKDRTRKDAADHNSFALAA